MPLYHHNLTSSYPVDSSPVAPTSNTYKGWTMSTNSVRYDWTGTGAFSAFNSPGWGSDDGADYWVKWTNGNPITIRKYSLNPTSPTVVDGSTGWRLQGSNDDQNWTTLHTHSSQDSYTADSIIELSNSTPFIYHRIYTTSANSYSYLANVKCYSGKKAYLSTGFEAFGFPVEYDSASAAGCRDFSWVDANTVLYIPMYGDSPFADQSQNHYTVTNNGATAVPAPAPRGSKGSGYFSGSSAYLLIQQEILASLSEFTLEVDYYMNTLPSKSSEDSYEQWRGGYYLASNGANYASPGVDIFLLSDGVSVSFYEYDSDRTITKYTQTTGVWRKLKITRSSAGLVSVYVDGNLINSYTDTSTIYTGSGFAIGRTEPYGEQGNGWDGYMANYRISSIVR